MAFSHYEKLHCNSNRGASCCSQAGFLPVEAHCQEDSKSANAINVGLVRIILGGVFLVRIILGGVFLGWFAAAVFCLRPFVAPLALRTARTYQAIAVMGTTLHGLFQTLKKANFTGAQIDRT